MVTRALLFVLVSSVFCVLQQKNVQQNVTNIRSQMKTVQTRGQQQLKAKANGPNVSPKILSYSQRVALNMVYRNIKDVVDEHQRWKESAKELKIGRDWIKAFPASPFAKDLKAKLDAIEKHRKVMLNMKLYILSEQKKCILNSSKKIFVKEDHHVTERKLMSEYRLLLKQFTEFFASVQRVTKRQSKVTSSTKGMVTGGKTALQSGQATSTLASSKSSSSKSTSHSSKSVSASKSSSTTSRSSKQTEKRAKRMSTTEKIFKQSQELHKKETHMMEKLQQLEARLEKRLEKPRCNCCSKPSVLVVKGSVESIQSGDQTSSDKEGGSPNSEDDGGEEGTDENGEGSGEGADVEGSDDRVGDGRSEKPGRAGSDTDGAAGHGTDPDGNGANYGTDGGEGTDHSDRSISGPSGADSLPPACKTCTRFVYDPIVA